MRPKGLVYNKCLQNRKKRINEINKLCRINYNITNKELIKKLGISSTEFYRNYNQLSKKCREDNKKESLFR